MKLQENTIVSQNQDAFSLINHHELLITCMCMYTHNTYCVFDPKSETAKVQDKYSFLKTKLRHLQTAKPNVVALVACILAKQCFLWEDVVDVAIDHSINIVFKIIKDDFTGTHYPKIWKVLVHNYNLENDILHFYILTVLVVLFFRTNFI